MSKEEVYPFLGCDGMRVILAEHAGFCNGVRRAMELAMEAGKKAKTEGRPITSLGELIHNREALKRLA